MLDSQNFHLFSVDGYDVSAFEREYFEEHGYSVQVLAGHLIRGVQAFADF